jgi:phosphomevalonate kinase
MAILIGVCGSKQHGKDTVAELLMQVALEHKLWPVRRAMADPLKEEVAHYLSPIMSIGEFELSQMMNTTGEKERFRLIMQWWGSEFRRTDDPYYWVKKMVEWVNAYTTAGDNKVIMIPDTRFTNELHLVQAQGGYLIKVVRPGFDSSDNHSSEQEWQDFQDWNYVIINDGTLDQLRAKVVTAYHELGIGK